MPTTITGDNNETLVTSLTGPAAGETMDVADVNDPFQSVLNNTLKATTYNVADFTALSAITAPVNGERFWVTNYGAYRYDSASSATVAQPWVIDGPSSVGRYIIANYTIRPSNQIVALYNEGSSSVAALDTTTNTSFEVVNAGVGSSGIVTIAGASPGLSVGDIVDIDAHFHLASSTSGEEAGVKMQYSQNGGAFADIAGMRARATFDGTIGFHPVFMTGRFTVTTAGSFRVQFMFQAANGLGTIALQSPYVIRATAIRP